MEEANSYTYLDPERQEKAKELARIQRQLMLLDLAIGATYLIVWILAGWSQDLQAWLQMFISNEWLLVPAFAFIFVGIYSLFNLPLSYYEEFVLPHRYGLSNQTVKEWIIDQIKMGVIGGGIGLIFLEIIYAVLRMFPETWWLWAAGFLLFFNVLLANLAPVLLFPIFYKFKPLGEGYADLEGRLLDLTSKARTKVQGVYQFDMSRRTNAGNAALTGLGNTRRIILADTLLDEFSDDEIETVLAHELGHHVHNDIVLSLIFGTTTTLLGLFLAAEVLRWGVVQFGFSNVSDIATLPLFGIALGLFGLVTMPLGNGFSRWRENLADDYALKVTDKPEAFASAMMRLANQNLAEADPEPWIEWLLYSHPALNKRIAKAQAFARIED
jgi:Zn-dependent protease with chaperone function